MWRYIVAFLLLFATAADARNFWPDGRPANFYRTSLEPQYASIANREPAICTEVLTALNKPHRPADMNISTNGNIVADILLSSELDVAWQRVAVEGPQTMLNFSPAVDLANISQPQVVVVLPAADGQTNFLVTFDHLPEPLRSGEPLRDPKYENIIEILGKAGSAYNYIDVNLTTTPEFPVADYYWAHSYLPLFYDLITVKGRVEILATHAPGANDAVWKRKRARVDVYVLDYQSKEKLPIICRFESMHGLTNKQGEE
jgi:hypothetical protein